MGWLLFYLWLGIGVLWFIAFTFTYYLYTLIHARLKVPDYLLVTLVWVTIMVGASIVTMLALGGK
jgi:hypothetical protein